MHSRAAELLFFLIKQLEIVAVGMLPVPQPWLIDWVGPLQTMVTALKSVLDTGINLISGYPNLLVINTNAGITSKLK